VCVVCCVCCGVCCFHLLVRTCVRSFTVACYLPGHLTCPSQSCAYRSPVGTIAGLETWRARGRWFAILGCCADLTTTRQRRYSTGNENAAPNMHIPWHACRSTRTIPWHAYQIHASTMTAGTLSCYMKPREGRSLCTTLPPFELARLQRRCRRRWRLTTRDDDDDVHLQRATALQRLLDGGVHLRVCRHTILLHNQHTTAAQRRTTKAVTTTLMQAFCHVGPTSATGSSSGL
jgi:hypothetical protein